MREIKKERVNERDKEGERDQERQKKRAIIRERERQN